jgi:Fur family transcriptional regulator, ferric uptake regulator
MHSVRVTPPRVAVVSLLASQAQPVSRADVLRMLEGHRWDPATIYRTLVRLSAVGIVRIVSRSQGRARYELAVDAEGHRHDHPHFVCIECKKVACLPEAAVAPELEGPWRDAILGAAIQVEGRCPECRAIVRQPPVGKSNANMES